MSKRIVSLISSISLSKDAPKHIRRDKKTKRWLKEVNKKLAEHANSPEFKIKVANAYTDLAVYGRAEILTSVEDDYEK